jgi:signal transduction histidine kinase
MGLLWTAAFALGTCAVLAFLIAVVLGAGRGKPSAVLGAVAALLLLVTLVVLRLRYGAVDAAAAERERRAAESQRRAAELERRGDERQAQHTRTLTEAVDHLVRVQLPAALNGSAVPQSLPGSAAGGSSEAVALCNHVVAAVAEGTAKLREQVDDQIESSRLAVVTLARRVQASAHRIQEEATRMAGRHPADSDVLESSMRVDHAAAQQARHAQSVAVLCGEWPGQQWPQPLALLDVVRAASSRIVAYRRVTVSGEPDVAATASVVEPLIHMIAELLANATQSSPPTTQVLVTVRTVQRGAVIEMDDGGVGMEEHRLEQAREIVSGHRLLRLGDLGEIPQTGMAVIGQYVRRHRFRVDLMPSPYGGVRAIVLVPAEMVENLEPTVTPLPLPAAEPEAGPAVTEPVGVRATGGMGVGPLPEQDDSLPQRQSRRGASEPAARGDRSSAEPAPSSQTPEQAGAWMAAYFSGSAGEPEAPGSTSAAPAESPPAESPPAKEESTAFPAGPARAAPSNADPLGNSTDSPGNESA